MKVKISLGTWLPMGILVIGGGVALGTGLYTPAELWASVRGLWPVLAAIVLHELGHILAARLCGVRLGGLRVNLFGARLGLCGMISYRHELLVAAAGPLVNLVSAAILLTPVLRDGEAALAAYVADGGTAAVFAVASLGLAAINLLPVRSLDGGRILRCVIAPHLGERIADGVTAAGTALCLGALWCFSVYALLRVGEMLSLFGFSLCLILRMVGGEEGGG